MSDATPSLFASLRQRRRNTFGKAYPFVSYDELQRLLDIAEGAHALLNVDFSGAHPHTAVPFTTVERDLRANLAAVGLV